MKTYIASVIFILLFAPLLYTVKASGLSDASATLSNPRLSYEAGVSATIAAGNTVITISNSGNGDNDTAHLFPGDIVTIGANPGLKVNSVIDATTFTINSALGSGIASTDKVYGAQSSSLVVSFTTGSAIPIGGSIKILVPASAGSVSGNTNDGLPEAQAYHRNWGVLVGNTWLRWPWNFQTEKLQRQWAITDT